MNNKSEILPNIKAYMAGSVRKKITAIIILPVILSLILVLAGKYIIYTENLILIVVRMEREWLNVNLNGFKYFNKYIVTGDKEDIELSLKNLERGYRINQFGPKMKALSEGEEISREELAKKMSEVFDSLTYEEAKGVIHLIGLLGSHKYVKILMEQWKGSFEDFEKNMPFVYEYSRTEDKALLEPVFKFAEDFKIKGDIFSEYSEKLSKLAYFLTSRTLWILFLIFSFITLTISFKYTNRMIKSFNLITDMLKIIADGDMTQRLNLEQKDEIGIMSQAVNSICEKMGKNISQVIIS